VKTLWLAGSEVLFSDDRHRSVLMGLSILGVPPVVNAALAGLLEFIPNIGPLLSVIPPMLLALLDAPWKVQYFYIS